MSILNYNNNNINNYNYIHSFQEKMKIVNLIKKKKQMENYLKNFKVFIKYFIQ